MIRAAFERNAQGQLVGYDAKGHSGYAEAGSDIICAGVSVLVLNCINSLEALCGIPTDETVLESDEGKGILRFRLPDGLSRDASDKAQLLMESLMIGLQGIAEQYPRYLQLKENTAFQLNGGKHK